MNCSEVLEQAPLFLNETVSAEIQRHLDSCPSCARQVAEGRAFDTRLKASILAEELDTTALDRRILRQIAEESAVRTAAENTPRPFAWPWAALGMMAAGAAAMVSFVVYQGMKPKPSPYSLAAAHDHQLEVVQKQLRRWRLDIPSAELLASTRGIPARLVSAVESEGYTFKEAKLCKLDSGIFLHIVYTDGSGKEFSLFLRNDEANRAGTAKRVFTAEPGEGHVAGFQDGAIEALVVTDQPGDAALRLARAAAQVI
jgi:hypothetical protein